MKMMKMKTSCFKDESLLRGWAAHHNLNYHSQALLQQRRSLATHGYSRLVESQSSKKFPLCLPEAERCFQLLAIHDTEWYSVNFRKRQHMEISIVPAPCLMMVVRRHAWHSLAQPERSKPRCQHWRLELCQRTSTRNMQKSQALEVLGSVTNHQLARLMTSKRMFSSEALAVHCLKPKGNATSIRACIALDSKNKR